LPWTWYRDPAVLELEQERIFRRSWQYVGRTDQLQQPGDHFATRAGDVPVAVVRAHDGTLNAFLNVCRHRGSLVVVGEGRRETLQCSYHGWTYDLDGSLRAAPRADREPDFDPSGLSLIPLAVDTWGQLVFVNPEREATPLRETLGELPVLLRRGGIDLDSLRFHARLEYTLEANWKIGVENYLECYHCPLAHPGFSAVVDVHPDRYRLEPHETFWSQFGVRRDGGPAHVDAQFHLLWPNVKLNVLPGPLNFSIGPVLPEGPERTSGFLDYFFGESVGESEIEELLAFDDQVGREDRALVESVQRGVRSGLLEHGRLLLGSEQLVHGFQQAVSRTLA
jgi:phenylpropionate dioxygenase-like ring-hydroxylating dioxygenase large terminal subunit